ncbi:hypothetical protein [Bifidobacterium oedipodis]|uniref:Lipoprotein n=1 Tax=Bifidobacterium oedipodis TaxID=2675322 RepID=A0A7Y0ERY0_9BIFI|nr:hypothetical protein [Bifidobacterium sp. DSM 109957]NMM94226.1 hypothetical protein [Bifidobacterium sp. DSM 109957]
MERSMMLIRTRTAAVSCLLAITTAMLLCSCAGPSERFVDAEQSVSGNQYEQLASAVLLDDAVSRAEAEQVLDAITQCLSQGGLTGEYGNNLDEYPWWQGNYGLSSRHELYQVIQDTDSREEQALMERQSQAIGQVVDTCDSYFEHVEETYMASADWERLDTAKAQGIHACFVNAQPEYAQMLPQEFDDTPGLEYLSELLTDNDFDDEANRTFAKCYQFGSADVKTYGLP